MKTLHLKIITPERTLFDEQVKQVSVPTAMGEITVLPHHIPVLSLLNAGEVKVVNEKNKDVPMVISGGFTEINGDKVLLLVDTAEHVEEIDVKRAEEAQERAQKRLEEKQLDAKEYAYLVAKIDKELARIRIGKNTNVKKK